MIRSIIVPLDGSEAARDAVPVAVAIAGQHRAAVELVHVHEAPSLAGVAPFGHEMSAADRREMGDRYRRLAMELANSSGLTVRATVLDGPPVPELLQHIVRSGADLVAMTTHGRDGMSRFWFGSVADALARRSDVPVLAIKRGLSVPGAGDPVFGHVLIPLDGSALAEAAIDAAVDLCTPGATSYVLLTVGDGSPSSPHQSAHGPVDHLGLVGELSAEDRRAHEYLARKAAAIREASGQRVTFHMVVHGTPARAILDISNEHAVDLIALATHGRSGLDRMRLGSVAGAVLHGAQCSVLLCRPAQPGGTPATTIGGPTITPAAG